MPTSKLKPNLLIIVDDSPFDLRINSGIAKHTNFFKEILCFSSAQATFDFLAENINNPQIQPHLIFLDIQMPEMDGFEFMAQYDRFPASFKKQSNVVMLSSTDDMGDIAKAHSDRNIIKLLKKPLNIEELKEVVSSIYDI